MRWDRLFDDLEARFEAEEVAAAAADLADLTRAEVAGLTLRARFEAQVGATLGWSIGADRVEGTLLDLGSDWVLLGHGRRELLVPVRAVTGVTGLARAAGAQENAIARRLGMGTVLRRLARDRVAVTARLAGPQPEITGTIDRVAADHLDLAEHPEDEFRRPATVLRVVTVPWHALTWVAVPAAGPA